MEKKIDELNKDYANKLKDHHISLFKEYMELQDRFTDILNQLKKMKRKLLVLTKSSTETIKSNSRLIKEIIFLNNRNLFQRIFNIQYKGND